MIRKDGAAPRRLVGCGEREEEAPATSLVIQKKSKVPLAGNCTSASKNSSHCICLFNYFLPLHLTTLAPPF